MYIWAYIYNSHLKIVNNCFILFVYFFFYGSTVLALRFLNQLCHFMAFSLYILGVPVRHILSVRHTISALSKNIDSLL